MFVGFAFMEKKECGHFVSSNLEGKFVVSVVFVFHDFSWDRGVNWWIGLWKDEELLLFEG
jgi:hypothetical protein